MVGRARRHVVRLPENVADDSRFCLAHIEAVDADAGAGKIAIQADTGNRLDGGDENPGVAQTYDVATIPNLVFFKDGKVVNRVIGVVPDNVLKEKLDALLR